MPRKYRIECHGPYRRWIVVRDDVDMSAHDTEAAARAAVEDLKRSEGTGA